VTTWVTAGGGGTTLAANALNMSGDTVKLGGTQIENTVIDAAGYDYSHTGIGEYSFEADSAVWRINGQKFLHMGSLNGVSYSYDEVALGYRAGANLPAYNSSANTLVGAYAGESLNGTGTNGASNALFGYTAGRNLTTGSYNTALGVAAMGNTSATVNNNVAIGHHALLRNTGNSNIGIGQSSLQDNTATSNVAVGHEAGKINTSGGSNTIVGAGAFQLNLTGSNNVGIGHQSLFISTGSSNTALGRQSGSTLTTGSSNILIGVAAEPVSTTGSNQLNIGNVLYGTGIYSAGRTALFGFNETAPDRTLHATLNSAITNTTGFGLRLTHQTSGTATTGFGLLQEIELENASGTNVVAASSGAVFTDATNASEDADYVVNLMSGGSAAAEKLRIESTGNIYPAAGYRDTSGDLGTAGQRLSSTGTGTNWVADTVTVLTSDSVLLYTVSGVEVGRDTIRTSGSGGGGGGVTGSGTTGTIPVFTSSTALGDSPLTVSSGNVTATGTGSFRLPNGTTAQRPGAPSAGETRYNTTSGNFEFRGATDWEAVAKSAAISGTGTANYIPYYDSNGRQTAGNIGLQYITSSYPYLQYGQSTTLTDNVLYYWINGNTSSRTLTNSSGSTRSAETGAWRTVALYGGANAFSNANAATITALTTSGHSAGSSVRGIFATASNASGSGQATLVSAINSEAYNSSTNGTTTLQGVAAAVFNPAAATVTTARGFFTSLNANSGTITNTYGVHVGDITTGTQTNTARSFYAEDANAVSVFNGSSNFGSTSAPNAVAVVEMTSTTQGFLPPRMTTTQRNAITAVAGLVIYNTTTNKLQCFDGTNWQDAW